MTEYFENRYVMVVAKRERFNATVSMGVQRDVTGERQKSVYRPAELRIFFVSHTENLAYR